MKSLHIKITAKPLTFKELKALVLKWRIVNNTLPCFDAVGWVNEFSRFNWIKFYRGNRINYHKQLNRIRL